MSPAGSDPTAKARSCPPLRKSRQFERSILLSFHTPVSIERVSLHALFVLSTVITEFVEQARSSSSSRSFAVRRLLPGAWFVGLLVHVVVAALSLLRFAHIGKQVERNNWRITVLCLRPEQWFYVKGLHASRSHWSCFCVTGRKQTHCERQRSSHCSPNP